MSSEFVYANSSSTGQQKPPSIYERLASTIQVSSRACAILMNQESNFQGSKIHTHTQEKLARRGYCTAQNVSLEELM